MTKAPDLDHAPLRHYRTREVAQLFGCSAEKVQDLARACQVGLNIGGSAGYRFTDQDIESMRRAMRPLETPRPRRPTSRRRSA